MIATRCGPLGPLLAVAIGLAACSPAPGSGRTAAPRDRPADPTKFHAYSLTIYGYNYTDTEIGAYMVNGRGGGNVQVSTPTSAGGSGVCCASVYTPLREGDTMRVKWTRDGDVWCEQDVPFSGPIPKGAQYLEVHFYRDGHIEIAVTTTNSPPRLRLEHTHANSRHADPALNVNNDAKLSRCQRGPN